MKEFLVFTVRRLVDRPEEVILHDDSDGSTYRYRLEVSGPDVGKIVGRNGQTIAALRSLIAVGAARQGKRAFVDVDEK